MAGSLKDQLLKAGIVDKKKAKKVSIEQRKQKRQAPNQEQRDRAEREQELAAAREAKAARDRALNEQRNAEQRERAITAQIKQLIERHRIAISEQADTRFQFVDGTLIKTIWIEESMITPLSRAQIRIARDGERYALLPAVIADRIEERRNGVIIPLSDDQQQSDEDDPYADYPIPDDLIW